MTDFLEYMGYKGSVEYSSEDAMLFGKVMFIDSLLIYNGHTVAEIKSAFIETIDAYLEYCQKINKSPNKPYKGNFNVRISPESHRVAAQLAATSGISLNEFVANAIEKEVSDHSKAKQQQISPLAWGKVTNSSSSGQQSPMNQSTLLSPPDGTYSAQNTFDPSVGPYTH